VVVVVVCPGPTVQDGGVGCAAIGLIEGVFSRYGDGRGEEKDFW
jgi:hypothetical protein